MSTPQRHRILVVDDDPDVRALLTLTLESEGYEVEEAADGPAVAERLANRWPDLLVLDVMLPTDDGLDILTRVRQESNVPVILLTGRDGEADRVLGLKLGADDYVVKPFSAGEVAARVGTILRRARPAPPTRLQFDGLTIDLSTREVLVDGQPVVTTAKSFDLLAFLASSPRQVFSREQLLDRVWHSSSEWQSTDTVTEHVRRLRRLIEKDPERPRWIATVWSVGYRFEP